MDEHARYITLKIKGKNSVTKKKKKKEKKKKIKGKNSVTEEEEESWTFNMGSEIVFVTSRTKINLLHRLVHQSFLLEQPPH
jgi:hypothetical protein